MMIAAVVSACGVTPHQATTSADAPKLIIDAGAPIVMVLDAGVVDVGVEAGAPVAAADPIDIDAGSPKQAHALVHLSGKCVEPLSDAKRRAKLSPDAKLFWEPSKVDLDGDGVDDFIIMTGGGPDYSGNVYITRGACGVMVLAWRGSEPVQAETSSQGFLDLETFSPCKPRCCRTRAVTSYKWDGQTYVKEPLVYRSFECGPSPASND